MTTHNNTQPVSYTDLIEIYHRIFDLKDTETPGSDGFVHCHDALKAIEVLLADAGCERPKRYDGKGRAHWDRSLSSWCPTHGADCPTAAGGRHLV